MLTYQSTPLTTPPLNASAKPCRSKLLNPVLSLPTLSMSLLFLAFSHSAQASKNSIDDLDFDSQSQFKKFAEDLTGALSSKSLSPPEPLGLAGFDIGVSLNQSNFKNDSMRYVSNNGGKDLQMITLHAVKGLPFDMNFGLDYSIVPDSNIEAWNAKLSYAVYPGGVTYPTVDLAIHYSQTTNVKAVTFNGYGAEVGISKGLANFTPYATLGVVTGNVNAREDNQGAAGPDLNTENVTLPKAAVGVNLNLLIMDVLVAVNQIGDVTTYSLKAGYRF